MEQNFQTSFIPKKPIVEERATTTRSVSFFAVIGIFVLFAVLLASAGLYFYKGVVVNSISEMEKNLDLAKNRFEPSKLSELQLLDRRLKASSEILSNHISITPIFGALEQLTMKTVRYTTFSYELGDESTTKKIVVKMSGVAVGYRSVALQSDLFAENKNLIDPVFSNLALDNAGNVLFDLEFSVDTSFVNYKQALARES